MNVLVVGGGNIGSYLVSILSEDKNNKVTLYWFHSWIWWKRISYEII